MNLLHWARQFKHGLVSLYLNDFVARLLSHALRRVAYSRAGLVMGSGSSIHRGVRFDGTGNFVMGNNSVINRGCRLDNRAMVTIGSNVSISEEVIVLTADHDPVDRDFSGRERPVQIDDYVFVGTRATILPGVNLGHGAVVAAGAVVTRSVEPFSIVAGVPARVVGQRRNDLSYSAEYKPFFR